MQVRRTFHDQPSAALEIELQRTGCDLDASRPENIALEHFIRNVHPLHVSGATQRGHSLCARHGRGMKQRHRSRSLTHDTERHHCQESRHCSGDAPLPPLAKGGAEHFRRIDSPMRKWRRLVVKHFFARNRFSGVPLGQKLGGHRQGQVRVRDLATGDVPIKLLTRCGRGNQSLMQFH